MYIPIKTFLSIPSVSNYLPKVPLKQKQIYLAEEIKDRVDIVEKRFSSLESQNVKKDTDSPFSLIRLKDGGLQIKFLDMNQNKITLRKNPKGDFVLCKTDPDEINHIKIILPKSGNNYADIELLERNINGEWEKKNNFSEMSIFKQEDVSNMLIIKYLKAFSLIRTR